MALFLGTDGHLFDIYLAFSGVVRHRGGEGHLGCKTGWSCVMSGRRWNCVKRDGRFRIGVGWSSGPLLGVVGWCMDVVYGCCVWVHGCEKCCFLLHLQLGMPVLTRLKQTTGQIGHRK